MEQKFAVRREYLDDEAVEGYIPAAHGTFRTKWLFPAFSVGEGEAVASQRRGSSPRVKPDSDHADLSPLLQLHYYYCATVRTNSLADNHEQISSPNSMDELNKLIISIFQLKQFPLLSDGHMSNGSEVR